LYVHEVPDRDLSDLRTELGTPHQWHQEEAGEKCIHGEIDKKDGKCDRIVSSYHALPIFPDIRLTTCLVSTKRPGRKTAKLANYANHQKAKETD
jgi:hypothetical protein